MLMTIESHYDIRGYFYERVTTALRRLGHDADEIAEYYLVELLARHAMGANVHSLEEPLVHRLASAAHITMPRERFRRFRDVGDSALYICGFFADRLRGKGLSRDYVVTLGGRAYRHAAQLAASADTMPREVYERLAGEFDVFARVLDEVREETTLRTPQDIVRLYDRWLRTGSPRVADRLREQGVFPQRPAKELLN